MREVREQLAVYGESRVSPYDILSLLVGNRDKAWMLLKASCGRFEEITQMSYAELRGVAQLTNAQACRIMAAFGVARRLAEERFRPGKSITQASHVAELVRDATRGEKKESFMAVLLDARHRIQSVRVVHVGTLTSCNVHPREVFAHAVRSSSSAVIVAHNHPSGDATPSDEDQRITDRLTEAGTLLGIQVLDHVVVGADRYYSYADRRHYTL